MDGKPGWGQRSLCRGQNQGHSGQVETKICSRLHKDGMAVCLMRSGRERKKEKRAQDGALRKPGSPDSGEGAGHVEEDEELRGSCFKTVNSAKCL